jgi:hypothetical protein
MNAWAAAAIAVAACRPAPPSLRSCADDLGGVWRVLGADATTPSGERRAYHVVDLGGALELYPMFDDSVLAPGDRKETTPDALIVAPSIVELTRAGDAIAGQVTRRVARGARTCVLHGAATIRACAGDHLQLELAPLAAPADWDRCLPPPAPPVTWTLVRERT